MYIQPYLIGCRIIIQTKLLLKIYCMLLIFLEEKLSGAGNLTIIVLNSLNIYFTGFLVVACFVCTECLNLIPLLPDLFSYKMFIMETFCRSMFDSHCLYVNVKYFTIKCWHSKCCTVDLLKVSDLTFVLFKYPDFSSH